MPAPRPVFRQNLIPPPPEGTRRVDTRWRDALIGTGLQRLIETR